ncbi:MAG: FadR/GntR family transcriptional regulator [Solirubrobacterales bacterium]
MQRDAALEAVFMPVRPPSTFEETVERLGTAIRLGLLPPGSRLPPERELAGKLRISRSTLRQALTTLVQSGLLVSLRGRKGGTFVSEQPPLAGHGEPLDQGAWAVLEYRLAIECGSVLLAAERAGAEQFYRLDELVERMGEEIEDFEDYRRADVRFHIGIAEAAGSPRLVSAMTDVQGQMTDLITLIPHPAEVLVSSNEQHRRLVKLLRKGDATRAVRLLREHCEGTEHILAGLFPPARRRDEDRSIPAETSPSTVGA